MKTKSYNKKRGINIFFMCLCLTLLFMSLQVSAAGDKLPSGITYDALEENIRSYIQSHEETSVGLAYSVFDQSGDIASGYYGYADKESEILVDDETVFEWGSGSKMLVWLSVMQVYEQGKLDLDADIRQYLPEGFLTNQKYDTPITMLHLMNHTAGFQDLPVDMSVLVDGYLTTLEEAVSAHKPKQIYKPGTVTAYSNWGTSLAAYIVGRISNMEFSDYVRQNIFEPLKMEHCAFSSNLSDDPWVKEQRTKLHCYSDTGELIENAYYYCTLYPSGGCVSTFEDYTRFAKALLSRSDKLLKEETWESFYTPTDYFGTTEIAKNCHGLWYVYFSVPTIGHIGKTSGCSSYILLDVENQIGAALICNQGNEHVLTEEMMSLFFGDYKTSEYYVSETVPEGKLRCAKMVTEGPFKFTGILGSLTKDMSKEYWLMSADDNRNVMEIAYMDYLKIPKGQVMTEMLMLAGFGIGIPYMILMLLLRPIAWIVRMLMRKEKKKYALKIWSIITSLLCAAVPFFYFIMLQSATMPSNTCIRLSMLIGAIMIGLIIMVVYGVIRNITAEIPRKAKIYNYSVILFSAAIIADIFYWELYMFWKI